MLQSDLDAEMLMPELIDSHCHLDRFYIKGELPDVMKRAAAAGLSRLIAVGTDMADWPLYYQLAREHPGTIDYTVGLHPCHVAEDWQSHIEQLASFWNAEVKPVALGEIGLDAFHLPKDRSEASRIFQLQTEACIAQLKIARNLDCPIVIHSRSAVPECVKLIDESGCDWSKVVFHCYTEGPDALIPVLDRGGRASFTGVLTFKSAEAVRQSLLLQGIDRLMLETDAPYLAPVPHRGKPCEPAYVADTAKMAAELLQVPFEELCKRTTANAKSFFNLAIP